MTDPHQPATAPAQGPAEKGPAAKPKSFAALHHPGFRVYFFASSLAMMGDNIEHVISYWMLYQRFQSPALGGIAILTHWLPFVFFSVYFGALADRFDPRRLIQTSMCLYMGVTLCWGLLFLTDSLEIWHAVVLLSIHGMAGVMWHPGMQMLIHNIVGRENLQSAVRLNSTGRTLGVLFGPGVGGALMLLLDPAIGLLLNAFSYVWLLVWLQRAPYGHKDVGHVPAPQRSGPRMGYFADIRDIFRQISGNRTIVSMVLLAGASSLLVGNAFQAQMPEFAHDLGNDHADFSYSMLLGANAAGALAAGIILESRSLLAANPRTAILLTIAWCFVIAGFAMTDNYPLAVSLMFVAGFLNLAYSSMSQTLVQLQSPPHLRGRLIGLYNLANNGMRAFSGLSVGVLGAVIGIHWSLALSAVVLLMITMMLLAFAMRAAPRAG